VNTKLIKKVLLAGLALVGLLAGQAVYAQASQSAVLTVNAVVPKACRFYAPTATLTIEHATTPGFIDPADTGNATGSTTIAYRCQNTVLPAFDIGGTGTYTDPKGPATVTLAGPGTMDAQITVTGGGAGTGLGAGNDINATIGGVIIPAQFSGALPGSYTVDVTIGIQAQ
jgi:hypothetical protein